MNPLYASFERIERWAERRALVAYLIDHLNFDEYLPEGGNLTNIGSDWVVYKGGPPFLVGEKYSLDEPYVFGDVCVYVFAGVETPDGTELLVLDESDGICCIPINYMESVSTKLPETVPI